VNATCPCHRIWTDPVRYAEHLNVKHHLSPSESMLLSIVAMYEAPVEYVVGPSGELRIVGYQTAYLGPTAL